jgi:hypothetical protein
MNDIKINICGDLVITNGHDPKVNSEIINYFSDSTLNVINLECPITKSENKIKKTGLHLKGDEKRISSLLTKLNVNLVTLANNHIFDYGVDGLKDTINFCNNNNINYFGAGLSTEEVKKPFYYNVNGKKITFLNFAENEWANAEHGYPGANALDIIDNVNQIKNEKLNADLVIVIIHGGNEYYNLPNPTMQKKYRFYADNGADIIIGHHPHCISGFEVYNDVPIFYSLGNFLFTKKSEYESWYNGIILAINITSNNNINFDLKYIKQSKIDYSVSFLNTNESNIIQKEMEIVNNIISDENLMLENWNDFLIKYKSKYLRAFSPINGIKNNKVKKFLIKAGLEKRFINKSHYFSLLNHIRCESHLEASLGVLKKYLKK